jgi:hypothetical protein
VYDHHQEIIQGAVGCLLGARCRHEHHNVQCAAQKCNQVFVAFTIALFLSPDITLHHDRHSILKKVRLMVMCSLVAQAPDFASS